MTEVKSAEQTLDVAELKKTADNVGNVSVEIGEAIEKLVERIIAHPIESIQGISEEDKQRIAEQQIEMCGLLERALSALIETDVQFNSIATQIEGWLKAHNNLVNHLNSTLLNREYLLSIIDGRVKEIDEIKMREHNTVVIKSKLTTVGIFEKDKHPELQPGQYFTYIVYPETPEKYSCDEIDKLSHNVVKFHDQEGNDVHVNRNEQPELFAAVSLKFSEDFTNEVAAGNVEPTNIKDKDGRDYTLLNYVGVYEFQNTSVDDANWDAGH